MTHHNRALHESRRPVDPEENLYRGIISADWVIYDNNLKRHRLTSRAFKGTFPAKNELSVDIASKTSPQQSLDRLPKSDGLVRFSAKLPRKKGLEVVEDPIPQNHAHALVISKSSNISKGVRRLMAENCVWVIPPKGDYNLAEPILDYDE